MIKANTQKHCRTSESEPSKRKQTPKKHCQVYPEKKKSQKNIYTEYRMLTPCVHSVRFNVWPNGVLNEPKLSTHVCNNVHVDVDIFPSFFFSCRSHSWPANRFEFVRDWISIAFVSKMYSIQSNPNTLTIFI